MRHFRILIASALIVAAGSIPVSAQEAGISVGLFGGFGGSPDSSGYDGTGFQLLGAMELSPKTYTGVRIGELSLEFDRADGSVLDADFSYVNVGTEYRRNADYYESGLLIGLGYYRLEAAGIDEDSLGLALGVTGDFRIQSRWSVVVEMTGHYADFDTAQFFLMGHAGVVWRF